VRRRSAYQEGRGSIIVRSRYEVEEGRGDRRSIVLTEIPYQVGKNGLVEKIAEAAKDKRIEGVSDIRDESNRHGVRIVIDLKRDATAKWCSTSSGATPRHRSSFPANMLAIRGGRPETLNLRDIIEAFVKLPRRGDHAPVQVRTAKARERAHILLGLVIAVSNLDEVVRSSADRPRRSRRVQHSPRANGRSPRSRPISAWSRRSRISEGEPIACPTSRFARSSTCACTASPRSAATRSATNSGTRQLDRRTARISWPIAPGSMRYEGRTRRRALASSRHRAGPTIAPAADGIEDEDLIEREDMVVTVTLSGYIKRTPLATFRTQARGGKGRAGMATKDEDVVTKMFVTSTHTPVLFFSTLGKVYRLKVYRLPEGAPQTKGRPMNNLLPLAEGETISTVLPLPEEEAEWAQAPHHVHDRQGAGPSQQHGCVHQHPRERQARDALRPMTRARMRPIA
jgi:DNA gyrase subunit A